MQRKAAKWRYHEGGCASSSAAIAPLPGCCRLCLAWPLSPASVSAPSVTHQSFCPPLSPTSSSVTHHCLPPGICIEVHSSPPAVCTPALCVPNPLCPQPSVSPALLMAGMVKPSKHQGQRGPLLPGRWVWGRGISSSLSSLVFQTCCVSTHRGFNQFLMRDPQKDQSP